MPKKEKIKKITPAIYKDILILLAGFTGLAIFAYGVEKTFLEVLDGYFWLIPSGVLLWLAILWRLFFSRRLFAYILLGLTLIALPLGWFTWQRQDQAKENAFVVLFSKFDMSDDQYGVRDQIVQQLKDATQGFGDTQIIVSNEIVNAADGAQSAAEIGTKEKADVLVWGFFNSQVNPNVSINIVDLSSKKSTSPKKNDIFAHIETISTFDTIVITRVITTKTNTVGLFLAGMLSSKRRDYATALKFFDQIIAENDSTTFIPVYDLLFLRAYALAGMGKTDLAIEAYNKGVLVFRKGAESYNNRGVIYANLGQNDLALQNYTTAIQINKNYTAAYNNRGNIYVDMQKFDTAMADFNKAVGIDPNYSPGYYNRGNAFYTQGQYEAAIKDYTKAIELDPKASAAFFNRGAAFQKLGKIPESEADFKAYTLLTGNQP